MDMARQRLDAPDGDIDAGTGGRGMIDSRSALTRTAFEVAQARAEESTRPDRLFVDPYASPLIEDGKKGISVGGRVKEGSNRTVIDHIAIRTRFYDDYLVAARTAGCEQIVLLAAGLDSRAFRLRWPWPTRLFELDQAELLSVKNDRLADMRPTPRCARTMVPVDLRTDWLSALIHAGFRPDRTTAWLAEGIMGYFCEQDAARLLAQVNSVSTPGSQIALEHLSSIGVALVALSSTAEDAPSVRRLWKGGLGSTGPALLSSLGWENTIHDFTELAETYGRILDSGPRFRDGGGFLTGVAR